MPSVTIRRIHRAHTFALVLGALALVVAACSSSAKPKSEPHTSSTVPSSTGTTLPGQSATPRATANEAVQVLLAAERRGDQAVSYRLLSAAGRKRYPHLADWQERRSQLPPITAFTISTKSGTEGGDASAKVVVEVRHKPGLDPFVGLSAGRERETWTAHREGSGWLVDPDPGVAYELPPLKGAAAAALNWARAVQACDKSKAMALQAVDELYGTATGTDHLCRSKGTVTVGKVGSLEAGPSSADLIAQYSTDALSWARVVPVNAPTGHFTVVVAPLGQVWKIVGLSD